MFRRMAFGAVALACTLAAAGNANAIVGLRGSTWGDVRQEIPKDGDSNLTMQGWVRQGIDWARWGNATLNTYATLRFKADTEKLDWNNSVGPGVGVALDLYSPKGLSAQLGVEYIWDRYFEADRSDQKVAIFVGWYGWWDLKR